MDSGQLAKGLPLEKRILTLRGEKVVLDADLAEVYGVTTKALNQAVKRNGERFPTDFFFRLTPQELAGLNRSQIVTGSRKHRDPRFPPYAFTEHGAIMAANVLQRIMTILSPPPPPPASPEPPRPEIGFHVREEATPYRVGRGRKQEG